ncbi:MAG: hypothetical protein HQK81_06230 [Desulfovibrionaceae bacterium]|nr:hypothetical protein [Desulfovibrionaceae bacterium]MBF0513647.1 hypothetical protein [Desulfovibrionaceae bacterium]
MSKPNVPAVPGDVPEIFTLNGMECVIRDGGDIYFTAEEVGKQLGYADPRNAIGHLYQRNVVEVQDHTTVVKLTTVDGKDREVRVFTEEGVYILSFLAQTDKAAAFRRSVAAFLKWARRHALAKAKIEGARALLVLTDAQRKDLEQVLHYRSKGLNAKEIGLLIGRSDRYVGIFLRQALELGLLDQEMFERGYRVGAGQGQSCRKAALCQQDSCPEVR